MKKFTKKRMDALQHYVDTTVGLWCIDRNPKDVTKEWIEENAFRLTAPYNTDNGSDTYNPKKIRKMKTHKKSSITINIGTLIDNLIVVTGNESEAPEAVRQKVAEALANIVKSIERHI